MVYSNICCADGRRWEPYREVTRPGEAEDANRDVVEALNPM
jgi:hypothetical protein